jgi:hypothetical protein
MNNLNNIIDPNFGYETREDYEKAVERMSMLMWSEFGKKINLNLLREGKLQNKKFTDIIGTKLYKKNSVVNILPNKSNISFDLELDAILCKKQFKTEEVFIKYKQRTNSKEKKVKWWHMFNFIIGIFKVKFNNKSCTVKNGFCPSVIRFSIDHSKTRPLSLAKF